MPLTRQTSPAAAQMDDVSSGVAAAVGEAVGDKVEVVGELVGAVVSSVAVGCSSSLLMTAGAAPLASRGS